MMSLQEAAQVLQAKLVVHDVSEHSVFEHVGIDSRSIMHNSLFFAIKGEHFDGHRFVLEAFEKGVKAAVVKQTWINQIAVPEKPMAFLIVKDPLEHLKKLASFWRQQFSIPVVAICGSNGKTTLKGMASSILEQSHPGKFLATPGNFNNEIGLSLSLLMLRKHHQIAIFELGINHLGETKKLHELCLPTIAAITNAQREHQAYLGSVDHVAQEHAHIFSNSLHVKTVILNRDDAYFDFWYSQKQKMQNVVSFSLADQTANVTGTALSEFDNTFVAITTPTGKCRVKLSIPGVFNALNCLAATAISNQLGVDLSYIQKGLSDFRAIRGRLEQLQSVRGATIINDTYNANPDSVKAAINVLASYPGKRILVLGDMAEAGEMSFQWHHELAGYARTQGIDHLIGIGRTMESAIQNFSERAQYAKTNEELFELIKPFDQQDHVLLIKGSRFLKLENLIGLLMQPKPNPHPQEESNAI